MVKNKYKSYQNYASSLRDYFLKTNKSICIFVKDTNEAMYLKNELQLILFTLEIVGILKILSLKGNLEILKS